MSSINMKKHNQRLKKNKIARDEYDAIHASEVGRKVDLYKELKAIGVDPMKYGMSNPHAKDRDAMPTLGLSPNPAQWNHNNEETQFFKFRMFKPIRKPCTANP